MPIDKNQACRLEVLREDLLCSVKVKVKVKVEETE
jgi:hypothetical protein